MPYVTECTPDLGWILLTNDRIKLCWNTNMPLRQVLYDWEWPTGSQTSVMCILGDRSDWQFHSGKAEKWGKIISSKKVLESAGDDT